MVSGTQFHGTILEASLGEMSEKQKQHQTQNLPRRESQNQQTLRGK
jgi:hypothetical protein